MGVLEAEFGGVGNVGGGGMNAVGGGPVVGGLGGRNGARGGARGGGGGAGGPGIGRRHRQRGVVHQLRCHSEQDLPALSRYLIFAS